MPKLYAAFPDLTDLQEASPVRRASGRVVPLACTNLGAGNRPRSWPVKVTRFSGKPEQVLPTNLWESAPGRIGVTPPLGPSPLKNPETSLTLIETHIKGGLAGTARSATTRLTSSGIVPDTRPFPVLVYA